MASRMEYARQPVARCLERMERTVDEIAAAIHGRSEATLSRRPAPTSWAAKEIVCHLRDIEELFMLRFRTMLAMDEPKFLGWARCRTTVRRGASSRATSCRWTPIAGPRSASTCATRPRLPLPLSAGAGTRRRLSRAAHAAAVEARPRPRHARAHDLRRLGRADHGPRRQAPRSAQARGRGPTVRVVYGRLCGREIPCDEKQRGQPADFPCLVSPCVTRQA